MPPLPRVHRIWQAALERRWAAPPSDGRAFSARTQYREHFALSGEEHEAEPAYPPTMPWYFRHTSRLPTLA
ncbi:MAG: hypothetical protein ACKOQ4_02965, partial [Mycobacterium sp.]